MSRHFRFLSSLASLAVLGLLAGCSATPQRTSGSAESAVGNGEGGGQMTIIFAPKDKPIEYGSPAQLLLSLQDGSVGHTMEEITCKRTDGSELAFMTGQSGGSDMEQRVKKDGWGFGIIFRDFEGVLQGEARIKQRLAEIETKGNGSFLRVLISAPMCDRISTFYTEYKKSDYLRYGLLNRPRHHEGGGCTSFGLAFLEVGGFMLPEYEEKWVKTLTIPNKLIGGPGTGRTVAVSDILLTFSWPKAGAAESREAKFWEPNFIHKWIVAKHEAITAAEGRDELYKTFERGEAKGLEIDARKRDLPTEPIFLAPAKEDRADTPAVVDPSAQATPPMPEQDPGDGESPRDEPYF